MGSKLLYVMNKRYLRSFVETTNITFGCTSPLSYSMVHRVLSLPMKNRSVNGATKSSTILTGHYILVDSSVFGIFHYIVLIDVYKFKNYHEDCRNGTTVVNDHNA